MTDAILNFLAMVMGGLFDALPVFTVPDWMTSAGSAAGTVFGYASSMGVWFPAGLTLTVLLALLAAWTFAYGVHIIRLITSLFTGGGGSV